MIAPLLSVQLSLRYAEASAAIGDIAFEIAEGEIFGLAGESGAGKSTLALAILRLLEMRGGRAHGRIIFAGRDLMLLPEKELRKIRGRDISLVLQSPVSALNPALRIETQFREAWRAHSSRPWSEARPDVLEALFQMGLGGDPEFLRKYPRQLSVGQAQRVVIAMAVLHQPRLIVADEPTSALDPGSRTVILDLFRRLRRTHRTTILYISHDLDSMYELCDRVSMLKPGGAVLDCSHATLINCRSGP